MFKKIFLTLKKNIRSRPVFHLLLYLLVRTLFATYRLEIHADPGLSTDLEKQPGVFYFWHQQIIGCLFFFFKKNYRGSCVVSPSGDGRIAGTILKKLGFNILYGSPHKQTISLLRQCLKTLNLHQQLGLVGDGSRGPAFILQPGVTYLAQKTHVPLIKVVCTASWHLTLKKSWDRFHIPLPFSKISVTLTRENSDGK